MSFSITRGGAGELTFTGKTEVMVVLRFSAKTTKTSSKQPVKMLAVVKLVASYKLQCIFLLPHLEEFILPTS